MKLIYLLLTAILISGCEGYIYIKACILDIETNKLIQNSNIYIKFKDSIKPFCVPNCPKYEVILDAPGYQEVIFQNNPFDFPPDSIRIINLKQK